MKITNWKWSVHNNCNRIATERTASGETYLNGVVITRHGIVDCYAQGGYEFRKHSRRDFFHKGKVYSRSYQKRFSKIGLSRMASRFAAEIIKQK